MQRPRIEHAFLPASLELQATPPSPLGRWLLWSLLLVLVATVAWSCWARIDIVASAGGKVVPGGKVKVVQAFEPGVIETIHVRDGEEVRRGDPLVDLDATEALARVRQIENDLASVTAQRSRLGRLREFIAGGPGTSAPITRQLDDAQHALLGREQAQHAARLAQFTGQRQQHREELNTVAARIDGLRGILELVAQRGDALETLSNVGHVSTEAWLKVAQEQRGVATELAVLEGRRRTLRTAIDNLDRDRDSYLAERLREITDAELVTQREQRSLAQELAAARARLHRHRLVAPVGGHVQQLAIHTLGGVVTPAQELLRIVPGDDELEIEALVLNRDIGEVRTGMSAVVKFQAYPFTRFGTLAARIEAISADAINDPALGLVYKARVRLVDERGSDHRIMRIEPGMTATVEIRIGERRVIELLLNPLLRAFQEAGREP
jgi:hemolysin D